MKINGLSRVLVVVAVASVLIWAFHITRFEYLALDKRVDRIRGGTPQFYRDGRWMDPSEFIEHELDRRLEMRSK